MYGLATIKDPTGTTIAHSAVGNRSLFTGREWVKDAGVYDYRNRVYSEQVGRFAQVDPVGFDAFDINLYRYARNNSILYTDPDGLFIKYFKCLYAMRQWQKDCENNLPCPPGGEATNEELLDYYTKHKENLKKCSEGAAKMFEDCMKATLGPPTNPKRL